MGVAGSGKTLIGGMLAAELGWPFFDADDFHSPENVEKMSRGVALTDFDRSPWLQRIRETLVTVDDAVLACSALTEHFRQQLRAGLDVRFVLLSGSYDLIERRLLGRGEHFFAPELLQSQFDTLEWPADAFPVNTALPPEDVVRAIRSALRR